MLDHIKEEKDLVGATECAKLLSNQRGSTVSKYSNIIDKNTTSMRSTGYELHSLSRAFYDTGNTIIGNTLECLATSLLTSAEEIILAAREELGVVNNTPKAGYIKYKRRVPDPGLCKIVSINFEEETLQVINRCVRLFPSFNEVEFLTGE